MQQRVQGRPQGGVGVARVVQRHDDHLPLAPARSVAQDGTQARPHSGRQGRAACCGARARQQDDVLLPWRSRVVHVFTSVTSEGEGQHRGVCWAPLEPHCVATMADTAVSGDGSFGFGGPATPRSNDSDWEEQADGVTFRHRVTGSVAVAVADSDDADANAEDPAFFVRVPGSSQLVVEGEGQTVSLLGGAEEGTLHGDLELRPAASLGDIVPSFAPAVGMPTRNDAAETELAQARPFLNALRESGGVDHDRVVREDMADQQFDDMTRAEVAGAAALVAARLADRTAGQDLMALTKASPVGGGAARSPSLGASRMPFAPTQRIRAATQQATRVAGRGASARGSSSTLASVPVALQQLGGFGEAAPSMLQFRNTRPQGGAGNRGVQAAAGPSRRPAASHMAALFGAPSTAAPSAGGSILTGHLPSVRYTTAAAAATTLPAGNFVSSSPSAALADPSPSFAALGGRGIRSHHLTRVPQPIGPPSGQRATGPATLPSRAMAGLPRRTLHPAFSPLPGRQGDVNAAATSVPLAARRASARDVVAAATSRVPRPQIPQIVQPLARPHAGRPMIRHATPAAATTTASVTSSLQAPHSDAVRHSRVVAARQRSVGRSVIAQAAPTATWSGMAAQTDLPTTAHSLITTSADVRDAAVRSPSTVLSTAGPVRHVRGTAPAGLPQHARGAAVTRRHSFFMGDVGADRMWEPPTLAQAAAAWRVPSTALAHPPGATTAMALPTSPVPLRRAAAAAAATEVASPSTTFRRSVRASSSPSASAVRINAFPQWSDDEGDESRWNVV